ncbi:F0F1 ATP synthase subunit B [Patescibacteria group bacterium]|nr:F0F1 ATP synthase subunit B [Patescibacteria group bacterium]
MDILNQFGVQPILLAAQVVNFLILLFILKRFMYKPLLKVLEERKRKIADGLKNAEEIERKLIETNEKMDLMITKASSEAQKIRDESRKEAAVFIEETKSKGEKIAADIIKKGGESLKLEKEKMEVEIRSSLSELVMVALQKVTGKTLSKKDEKEMIEKEIKKLS